MANRWHLLANRDFARLWAGYSVSQFGGMISDTALVIWVGVLLLPGKPAAPAVAGAMILAATLVSLATAPIAGVLVDRWDCRRVMMCTDIVRGAVTLLFALALTAPPQSLGTHARLALGFVVITVCSASAQFFAPARVVLLSKLVPADKLGRASSYNQATYSVLGIVAPTLAAILVVSLGMPAALLIDAASYLVSWLAIRAVRTAVARERSGKEPAISFWSGLTQGLRIALREPPVAIILFAIGLVALGSGGMTVLMVYFVQHDLHAGGAWYGILESALAVGAVGGGLLAGRLGERLGHGRIYGTAVLGLGLLIMFYAQLTSTTIALPTAVTIGAMLGGANAVFVPLLVARIPEGGLGRVYSLVNMTSQTATLVSVVVSTSLVTTLLASGGKISVLGLSFGPIDAMFTAAGILCALGGAAVLWHNAWRLSGHGRGDRIQAGPVAGERFLRQ